MEGKRVVQRLTVRAFGGPELLTVESVAEAPRVEPGQLLVDVEASGINQLDVYQRRGTTDVLFRDLWLASGAGPRDRSLVTVSALIGGGQVAQITYHLDRAMDNGLAKEQASEVLTHLALYAGWPNVFSTLPVPKAVFESRTKSRLWKALQSGIERAKRRILPGTMPRT